MSYSKKTVILSEVTSGFSRGTARGMVYIERTSGRVRLTLNAFGLDILKSGKFMLGVSAKDMRLQKFELGKGGKICADFALSAETNIEAPILIAIVFVDRNVAVPVLFGANGNRKSFYDGLLEGFIVREEIKETKKEESTKGRELENVGSIADDGTETEGESEAAANKSGESAGYNKPIWSNPYNAGDRLAEYRRHEEEYRRQERIRRSEKSFYSDEQENEAAYVQEKPTLFDEIIEQGNIADEENNYNTAKKRAKKKIIEDDFFKPFDVGERGNKGGEGRGVFEAAGEDDGQPSLRESALGAEYSDAQVAAENYYPERFASEAGFTIDTGVETNRIDPSKIVFKKPLTFYENIKQQIDALFEKYPTEDALCSRFKNTRWVKVDYSQNGKFYVVGVIGGEGKDAKYICYGVPAKYSDMRPEELSGCQWLPLDETEPKGEGYWVLYQSAETGEAVDLEII